MSNDYAATAALTALVQHQAELDCEQRKLTCQLKQLSKGNNELSATRLPAHRNVIAELVQTAAAKAGHLAVLTEKAAVLLDQTLRTQARQEADMVRTQQCLALRCNGHGCCRH